MFERSPRIVAIDWVEGVGVRITGRGADRIGEGGEQGHVQQGSLSGLSDCGIWMFRRSMTFQPGVSRTQGETRRIYISGITSHNMGTAANRVYQKVRKIVSVLSMTWDVPHDALIIFRDLRTRLHPFARTGEESCSTSDPL